MFIFAFAESAPIQLLPDGSLLIHIAMILAMIWILNRTLFRPINKLLESRENNRGGRLDGADEILEKAAQKANEYSKGLQEARLKGYLLIEKNRNLAVTQKQETIADAKEEIRSSRETRLAELETLATSAKETIDTEAGVMAIEISSKVLNAAE